MGLEPIEYRGELVVLVGADRFHLIAPRLLACPAGDAELRFVTFMCVLLASHRGRVDGPTVR